MARFIQLSHADNILLAIDPLMIGDKAGDMPAKARIPRGHKMAIRDIASDEPVVKYGQTIGFARGPIAAGDWVHEHNVYLRNFERDYLFGTNAKQTPVVPEAERASFMGYRRPSGKVGTRNFIAVLTSVNCSASVARFIVEEVNRCGILRDYPNVDGVISLVHGTGCGIDTKGPAYDLLKRTQWGFATNPNVGGVLMVGLGCEAFQIPRWMQSYNIEESTTFRTMTIQETGGTRKTVEAGVKAIVDMLPMVNAAQRTPQPASELVLALQCGGSDGYSGISANPALGAAVDLLVAQGGTAVLSETPEIYGAEHLLTMRAENRAVGEKLIERIRWWEDYTAKHDMEMNNNPSPGNKLGGLTTILEKSLGASAKGGTTNLRAVLEYAEPINERGLVFMDTPGYDPVSATGQVAGGANILCFTTGRGSAFGCKPTPSIKLASNSFIFEQMREDMDINCGDILDGVTLDDKGQEIFAEILRVASGARTKSELLGYGDNEFVPWNLGATM
ncbi:MULTISPECIES: UxaA family hydrolase [unclassified Mesorhizobium]|uniref:UxaA family hydrolase n=1 Tax=unclassified Mesorhizobium TaxID=325217 RepID=UPI00112AD3AA|nr:MULTISPECIES: altronate dehydratase family protein [unclassified Mesorhizobium]TPJ41365.1 altronate dehydratase [Mesorhizobium sp. B2-6-6]MBZ9702800.1 altronate dehydratase family protein [Mesorhizobium sp. CO1-1-3]MBZ9948481.1 altronate dehydratase family protein [Mesorhizobium sp. BR1-1-11]MCA0002387.1 altronate dehydratase family protein [Mesorhizobium sp. B264B2A]MCA0008297.1 altronate dehydratase family protein [Mesorhizobium sp. B264B1B]